MAYITAYTEPHLKRFDLKVGDKVQMKNLWDDSWGRKLIQGTVTAIYKNVFTITYESGKGKFSISPSKKDYQLGKVWRWIGGEDQ